MKFYLPPNLKYRIIVPQCKLGYFLKLSVFPPHSKQISSSPLSTTEQQQQQTRRYTCVCTTTHNRIRKEDGKYNKRNRQWEFTSLCFAHLLWRGDPFTAAVFICEVYHTHLTHFSEKLSLAAGYIFGQKLMFFKMCFK